MRSNGISCLLFMGFFISVTLHAQDNGSVGIGTENPNPNAILHLVSPGNNQGLLIPSVTSAQRLAPAFTSYLNTTDNGLLVFDLTEKTFYYWKDSRWETFMSSNQTLQFDQATNQLTLQGGNTIDLSTLTITDWNDLENTPAGFKDGIDEVEDADADPANEIQDLVLTGSTLQITNNADATSIDLSGLVAPCTNQSLSFQNQIITLSNDPNATFIDLSNYDSDVTDDFNGQFASLSGVPAELLDGDQIDDADADATNEIQSLQLIDDALTLSGDPSGTTIDFSDWDQNALDDFDGQFASLGGVPTELLDGDQIDDADADATNEIQSLQLIDDALTLSGDPSGITIDFSGWDQNVLDDFDGQFASLSGVPTELLDGDQVDDADADAANEIQSLQLVGDALTLSGDPSGTMIDFSGWDQNALDDFDGQFASLSGVPTELLDGDQINDADANPTNEIQTLSLENDLVTLSRGGGSISINDNDADSSNELITTASLQMGNTLRIVESGTNHDIDLSSLVEDADADPNNEIQSLTYNSVSNVLTLTKPSGNDIWDLSELDDATPWIEENNATNINYTGKYAISNNMISRSNPAHVSGASLEATIGALRTDMINSYKTVVVVPGTGTPLRNIDPGIVGQELLLMIIGPGTLNVDGQNGNIFLSSTNHTLTMGSTLHLVYFKDQSSGTNFDGWMELSVSKAVGR